MSEQRLADTSSGPRTSGRPNPSPRDNTPRPPGSPPSLAIPAPAWPLASTGRPLLHEIGRLTEAETDMAQAIAALRERGELRLLAESLAARARALDDAEAAAEAWSLADRLGYLPTAPLRRQIPARLTGVTKPG